MAIFYVANSKLLARTHSHKIIYFFRYLLIANIDIFYVQQQIGLKEEACPPTVPAITRQIYAHTAGNFQSYLIICCAKFGY